MDQDEGTATVVVIESSRCMMATDIDFDTALTLIALVSEDPSNWDEATSVWRRYRTPAVCEFVSSVPLESTDQNETIKSADLQSRIDEAVRASAVNDSDLDYPF